MNAFSVFATLSLFDLASGPLGKIDGKMKALGKTSGSLGHFFSKLTTSMLPIAAAAGTIAFAFGLSISAAAGFQDKMAEVGAVSRASASEMVELEDAARKLGATTRYSASEVAEAQKYLAMAGFTVKENIEALPGMLDLAAATATDLGTAADIASDILSGFGLKADQMGRAADVLALTTSTANTDLIKLGDTMSYVAPVARQAGLSLEEAAAMAGLLGNVGIKGSMAGTSLKAMLSRLSAPAGEATKALKAMGVTLKDAKGNLRSPVTLLGEMAVALKEMGSAEQMAAAKAVVGQEAVAGFLELINQEGVGAITKYAEQLNNAEGAAAEMSRRMNDTLKGDIRSLGSVWESLNITVGKIFIPISRSVVQIITAIVGWFDRLAQSELGASFIKTAGAISSVVLGVTLLSAALWGLSVLIPLITASFAPLGAVVATISLPIWALITAIVLLYLAYKKNFGGMKEVIDGFFRKVALVFRAVNVILSSLRGNSVSLRGELGAEIKANGLVGLVTTIGKIARRLMIFFRTIADSVDLTGILLPLYSVKKTVVDILGRIGAIFSRIFGGEVTSSAEAFRVAGELIADVISLIGRTASTLLVIIAEVMSILLSCVEWIIALFSGDWTGLEAAGERIWQSIKNIFNGIFDLFTDFNLTESGEKLMTTFVDGIKSMAMAPVNAVKNGLAKVRQLLPFSDAKEGPLSQLTKSGASLLPTFASGVTTGESPLKKAVLNGLSGVGKMINDFLPPPLKFFGEQDEIPTPDITSESVSGSNDANQSGVVKRNGGTTIHIGQITLPKVQDANVFITALQQIVDEYSPCGAM